MEAPCAFEFRRALKDRPWESVETLLEKAFDFSSQGKANCYGQQLSEKFKPAINRFFYLIGWNVNWSPLEKFLKEQSNAVNVTHSFRLTMTFCWTVPFKSTPGIGASKQVTGSPPNTLMTEAQRETSRSPRGHHVSPSSEPDGSLNWLVPEKHPAGTGFEDGPVTVITAPSGKISYFKSPDNFNWDLFTICGDAPVGLYIVPPVGAEKSQSQLFIKEVRKREEEAIAEADEIYLIGWSLPKTDKDQEP